MNTGNFFDEYGHERILRLPEHLNPGLEIVYIKNGHLFWQCEGREELVSPETVYFTLPWQRHGSTAQFESGHELYFFVLKLNAMDQKLNHGVLPEELGFSKDIAQKIIKTLICAPHHVWLASRTIAFLMPELIEELKSPGAFHQERVYALTSQILIELSRIIEGGSSINPQKKAAMNKMSVLLSTLDRRLSDPWTLEDMAAEVGLKRTRFASLFWKCTGDTPVAYLNRLRVAKARNMLQETDLPITAIAFECGFSSSQYFCNIFKKFTGISARTYRESGLPDVHPKFIPKQQLKC